MIVALTFSWLLHAPALLAPVEADAPVPAAQTLGLEVADLPPAYPSRYGAQGAYVVRVVPGGPGEAARILPGDVVASVAAHAVHDASDLRAQVAALAGGSAVPVVVERYGKTLTLAATPAGDDVVYARAPLCEPREITTQLAEAATSLHHRDDDNAAVHGARALDLAEACTALQARYDEWTLLRIADAYATIGTADADAGDHATAGTMLANAWVVDRLVPTAPVTSGEGRTAAATAAASLVRRDSGVTTHADGAILAALAYAGANLGAAPFAVENSWVTQGPNFGSVLHVRVKIDVARDALLYAGFFTIKTSSPDIGTETFAALDRSAPDTVRGHTPIDSARHDVAPAEDFGSLGHVFFARNEPATYVLTFAVTDRFADLKDAPSTLAYTPN